MDDLITLITEIFKTYPVVFIPIVCAILTIAPIILGIGTIGFLQKRSLNLFWGLIVLGEGKKKEKSEENDHLKQAQMTNYLIDSAMKFVDIHSSLTEQQESQLFEETKKRIKLEKEVEAIRARISSVNQANEYSEFSYVSSSNSDVDHRR